MSNTMSAIEMTGRVINNHQLLLDGLLPIPQQTKVKVIVLYPTIAEINETDWMQGVATNPAFAFLHDEAENIYTVTDGEPFDDKI